MKDSIFELILLDEYSEYDSAVHNIHPVSIFIVTLAFVVTILSFDKYETVGMLPMLLYPVFMFEMSGLPKMIILKKMMFGLVFVVGVGIFNPLLDRNVLFSILGIEIIAGWLSFISLIIRGGLAIIAALFMVAILGMNKLIKVLYLLRVPKIFVLQLVLTFRYISVLLEEVSLTFDAYRLRSNGQKGIHFKSWGTFLGHILLRTFDRAERIYEAMSLRGFNGEYTLGSMDRVKLKDIIFVSCWIAYFLTICFVDIPYLIGVYVVGG
jgi:cobalt/nickel transport system permease protein